MVNGLDFGLLLLAGAILTFGVGRTLYRLRVGRPGLPWDEPGRRLGRCLAAVIGHREVLREPPAGRLHGFLFAAFAGMLVLIVVVQLVFRLPSWLAGPAGLGVEVLGVAGLYGTWRLYRRRYREQPDRLDNQPQDRWALVVLLAIFASGFLVTASRIGATGGVWNLWHPVGYALSLPLQAVPETVVVPVVGWVWRIHLFLVLFTIAALPYGKFAHSIFAPLNLLFRERGPKGAFEPLDIENSEEFGAGRVERFTRKQLLDLEACMRCGRCQSRCPAHATDKTLNPKKVVQDLRRHWLVAGRGRDEDGDPMIDGSGVRQSDIWSCTTCRHCVEVCPVAVNHVDKLVDMRRHLVLMEGQMPAELITLNRNLENNYNPWGVGWSERNNWMERRNVSVRLLPEEEEPEFDVLLWVGCAGSFDDRYQRVAAATVRILERAGVSFGVLGTAERCCGDPARASGNEYLYQQLVADNIAAMDAVGVRKIVTTCPHCLKTLAKEYPQFGGHYEVVHHVDFLLELLSRGRIRPVRPVPGRVTVHDSCYLSRYADTTEQPRALLRSVESVELVEMEKRGRETFCCGGGGGRMWMEEEAPRINNERAGQALSTGAGVVASACPFCLTMLGDGVKAQQEDEEVQVLDLAEILERSLA